MWMCRAGARQLAITATSLLGQSLEALGAKIFQLRHSNPDGGLHLMEMVFLEHSELLLPSPGWGRAAVLCSAVWKKKQKSSHSLCWCLKLDAQIWKRCPQFPGLGNYFITIPANLCWWKVLSKALLPWLTAGFRRALDTVLPRPGSTPIQVSDYSPTGVSGRRLQPRAHLPQWDVLGKVPSLAGVRLFRREAHVQPRASAELQANSQSQSQPSPGQMLNTRKSGSLPFSLHLLYLVAKIFNSDPCKFTQIILRERYEKEPGRPTGRWKHWVQHVGTCVCVHAHSDLPPNLADMNIRTTFFCPLTCAFASYSCDR